ncbi:hypothetical protein TKV_c17700 [Thermoanaerobacter kivui]|uniref:Uncharacterized protein n=1 Tax=Thermoanaerobacter kivui TaxID=2325 RepID=A0A097ASX4_THEKI|nr:hypothetical protein [Thermoanaerobacter kivui]AIS52921.1 hypothetical protein TKV_c17700 [Thermoanaerobacter kivui]
MGEAVQLILIFCTTIVAIVGIVALVVCNRDKIQAKIRTHADVTEKFKSGLEVEIKDNSAETKK